MVFTGLKKKYRHILILDSRDWFTTVRDQFNPSSDLVLTYDFALRLEIERLGGQALYVDHLVEREVMQQNNFLLYKFFRDWHLDDGGKDIFTYCGVPFGFAFRLEIWNDFVFHVRNRLCLEMLRKVEFGSLLVGTQLGLVERALEEMGFSYSPIRPGKLEGSPCYYFPIHRWMDEKLRTRKLKHRVRDIYTAIHGSLIARLDKLLGAHNRPAVFIQEYYPTREILQRLKQDPRLRVVQVHYSWAHGLSKYLFERTIPVWGKADDFQNAANDLMHDFHERRHARFVSADGIDLTESVYRVIEERISGRIAEVLRTLDCVIRYLDRNPVSMEILIANIGLVSTLVDCVCKSRKIPSYLIINGLMGGSYLDEGKYATFINSYSASIKENYFFGMDNVVCLGDPRMDAYMQNLQMRQINRNVPTITIGASGHSNIDLNSWLAVEFDFLYDILKALSVLQERGNSLRAVVKVRDNGYRAQYQSFVNEYFPDLAVEILDSTPMSQVLRDTDFYISIYSQTIIEASCLGIPCLYYKKDNQYVNPPFDGASELVTVGNVDDLVTALDDFRSGSRRYDAFMQRSVIEKYIGPLDGKNLERNLRYIYKLMGLDEQKGNQ